MGNSCKLFWNRSFELLYYHLQKAILCYKFACIMHYELASNNKRDRSITKCLIIMIIGRYSLCFVYWAIFYLNTIYHNVWTFTFVFNFMCFYYRAKEHWILIYTRKINVHYPIKCFIEGVCLIVLFIDESWAAQLPGWIYGFID